MKAAFLSQLYHEAVLDRDHRLEPGYTHRAAHHAFGQAGAGSGRGILRGIPFSRRLGSLGHKYRVLINNQ